MKPEQSCVLTHKCTVHSDLHRVHDDVLLRDDVHDDVHHWHPPVIVNLFSLQSTLVHFYNEKYRRLKRGPKRALYRRRLGITKRSVVVLCPTWLTESSS